MFDIITALCTNFFRTFIIKKFITIFFTEEVEDKRREAISYLLFYITTTTVYLVYHFPPTNIITNLLMIYFVICIYGGDQKKKILVTMLIYGINMFCDILSIYSFSNYIVGEGYNEIAAYITVLLISICEFVIERYAIRNKNLFFTPPYWNVMLLIPFISIILLLILLMNNLNKT